MKYIPAVYYNGVSSKPYKVSLLLSPSYIEINFNDESLEPVTWKISEISKKEQINSSYLRLFNSSFPPQVLEIESFVFAELLENKALKEKIDDSAYSKMVANKKSIFALLLSLISFGIALYFFILPFLSHFIVERIPRPYEIKLGNGLYQAMIGDEEIDSARTEIVNRFWKEMHYNTAYPVRITVVKSDEMNAFALPGGNIVVYDSLLNSLSGSEELAALLSHEYIHIKNRHSLNSLVSSFSRFFLIRLMMGGSNSTGSAILENADQFKTLTYSRTLEKEADQEGMQMMYEKNIDPAGMYELFKKLSDSEKEMLNVPEYLNTHPLLKSRLQYSKQFALKHKVTPPENHLQEIFISIMNCKKN